MSTIMLHAPDKVTMDAALEKFGVLEVRKNEAGMDYLHPAKGFEATGYGGAILPPIWKTKPVYATDGTLTTPGAEISGYSANVLDTTGRLQQTTTDPLTGATTVAMGTYPNPAVDADGIPLPPLPIDWASEFVKWVDPAKVKTPAQGW